MADILMWDGSQLAAAMVGLEVLPQAVPRLEDLAAHLALHARVHVLEIGNRIIPHLI